VLERRSCDSEKFSSSHASPKSINRLKGKLKKQKKKKKKKLTTAIIIFKPSLTKETRVKLEGTPPSKVKVLEEPTMGKRRETEEMEVEVASWGKIK